MDTKVSEHDAKVCQLTAEALWQAATSEDHGIAWCHATIYTALEKAFMASLRRVYGLKPARVTQVRDLLSEYGPHDSLTDTNGRGVSSYVEYVLAHSSRETF